MSSAQLVMILVSPLLQLASLSCKEYNHFRYFSRRSLLSFASRFITTKREALEFRFKFYSFVRLISLLHWQCSLLFPLLSKYLFTFLSFILLATDLRIVEVCCVPLLPICSFFSEVILHCNKDVHRAGTVRCYSNVCFRQIVDNERLIVPCPF